MKFSTVQLKMRCVLMLVVCSTLMGPETANDSESDGPTPAAVLFIANASQSSTLVLSSIFFVHI